MEIQKDCMKIQEYFFLCKNSLEPTFSQIDLTELFFKGPLLQNKYQSVCSYKWFEKEAKLYILLIKIKDDMKGIFDM